MFDLVWGLLISQSCILGLFLLEIYPTQLFHSLGQVTVIVLTIFCTTRYISFLRRTYQPVLQYLQCRNSSSNVEEKYRPIGQQLSNLAYSNVATKPVIWLPKDSLGISQVVVENIQEKVLNISGGEGLSIIHGGATVSKQGHIILRQDAGQIAETLEEYRDEI